jgi:tartrate dehydrogenase/decarboxylase/D-malate dehydrogenase
MMLEHLGEGDAAQALEGAMEAVLTDESARTRDLGGKADTETCPRAMISTLEG